MGVLGAEEGYEFVEASDLVVFILSEFLEFEVVGLL
jgi:hypothetical protein